MLIKMIDVITASKGKGKVICQNGELDFEDPAVEEGFADLKAAIMTGRTDIVRMILSAAQSYRDDEELFAEAEDENGAEKEKPDEQEILDLLQMLLNFRDNDAGTCLHHATKLVKTDIVRSLLAAGANPTLKNLEDATPYDYCESDAMKTAYIGALMQAVAQSKSYRVNLLLDAGVDVNSGDGAESDNKSLHWAASFADADIVKLLIDAGADVNAVNGDGASALHDAVVRGDEQIIVELLTNGAKLNIVPFKGPLEGSTSYDLTIDKPEAREIFQEYLLTSVCHANGNVEDAENTNESGNFDESASTSAHPFPTLSAFLSPLNDVNLRMQESPDENNSLSDESRLSQPHSAKFQPILLPPKSPMKLFFPALVELDSSVSQLWPPPKKILQYKGTFYVPPLNLTFVLMSSKSLSLDCLSELMSIMEVMKPKFKTSGTDIQTDFSSSYSSSFCCSKGNVECFIDPTTFCHGEEYRLQISTRKVKIVASSIRSFFYAINTFLQCLRIFQGKGLPLLQISDWPDMSVRGIQLDFHEGDIPKLDNLLQFFDVLSGFKVNQLHLPAELFLPDDQNRNIHFTRSDLLRVHEYCKRRYMEVIPVLRSSDILGNVNVLSYASMKSDILPLFPSCRFVNISMPSNEKLKTNRNMLTGITDSDLVRRIESLHEFCVSNGLTLLLDSSLILQQPVKLLNINHNLICMNMSQESTKEATCEHLCDLGIPHVEAPCYKDEDTIMNDARTGLKVYEGSTQMAKSNGALGVIIRYEAKASNLCSFSIDFASLAVGAAMAWRSSPNLIADDTMLTAILNRHIYQDHNDVIGGLLLTLSSVEQIELLGRRTFADKTAAVGNGPIASNSHHPGLLKAIMNSSEDLKSNLSSVENLKITTVSLKQLQASTGRCSTKWEAREMVTEEVAFLIKILLFLCRIGMTLYKSSHSNKEVKLEQFTQIQRSDLSNKLMGLTEQYESFCCSNYNETPNGLISVALLKRLLKKLYPEQELSFFNSFARTFTV